MADEEEIPQPVWNDLANENPGPFSESGKPHGQGTLTFPPPPQGDDEDEKPGDAYVGELVEGIREGRGKYTWSNGCQYDGTYVSGKKSGMGVLTFPGGGKYDGEFKADVIAGRGKRTYSNGDVYIGMFVGGKKHGQGCYHFAATGCQFAGSFEGGHFRNGRWIYKDGSTTSGEFVQQGDTAVYAAQGPGTVTFKRAGLMQKGEHCDGRWEGGAISVL